MLCLMKLRGLLSSLLLALTLGACGRVRALDADTSKVDPSSASQVEAGADQSDAETSQIDLDAGPTDVDGGQSEPCDAGNSCVYSCEAGPPDVDAAACGSFGGGGFMGGCTDSVDASYPVGCRVWSPSCSPGVVAACMCISVPQTQKPDAAMITAWGCPA
jgi:hypothetical protein